MKVFMTQHDTLQCVHEPFGDAFYYGPERLSSRYENDPEAREASGFSQSTYQTILDRIEKEATEVRSTPPSPTPLIFTSVEAVLRSACSQTVQPASGKRLFIKDITHYLVPPDGNPSSIAPSLNRLKRGVGTSEARTNGATNGTTKAPYPYHTDAEPNNPTVIPRDILEKFHFTFLIRNPRSSIPSYYRCTVPPLDKVTGFYNFMPSEAGYNELRRVFDYLRSIRHIGPANAGQAGKTEHSDSNGVTQGVEVCVVDADDLLDDPAGIIQAYCKSVGIQYHPDMLKWDTEADQRQARDAFEKWKGFHEDVLHSSGLRRRGHVSTLPRKYTNSSLCVFVNIGTDVSNGKKKKVKSIEDENAEWREKYGEDGAKIIRETVDANMGDYEYLKQFAIKV
ncbi:MAG: hypothetical protein Q9196_003080 [Gyalolechia fulgens]